MSSGKSDREQRLAEALRANLRKRKGQARGWAQGDPPRPDEAPAAAEPDRDPAAQD